MRVRVASEEDIEQITDVHVASWKSAYRGLIPKNTLENIDREARRAMWARTIAERPSETVISTSHGEITGLANFGKYRDSQDIDHCGEIRAIYVLEKHWRKGIGSKLLEYAVASLSRNHQEVVLWVLKSNTRAIEFYERHGFSRDGIVKAELLSGVTLNEIRLFKAISSYQTKS